MTIDIKAIRLRASKADETIWITSVESNATVLAMCDEIERLRKDAARYQWIAWRSDTNPIMPINTETNRLYFGYECDAAIDAAMEAKT